jgi:hypothetical protein
MKEHIKRCSKDISKKKFDCQTEKGKTFTLINNTNAKVIFINVDGCLFKDETLKCDFMYEIYEHSGSVEKVFYVELKGTDFNHGIKQLRKTIDLLKNYYSIVCDKRAYLVGRAIPSLNTVVQKVKIEFFREHGVRFQAKTKCMSVDV